MLSCYEVVLRLCIVLYFIVLSCMAPVARYYLKCIRPPTLSLDILALSSNSSSMSSSELSSLSSSASFSQVMKGAAFSWIFCATSLFTYFLDTFNKKNNKIMLLFYGTKKHLQPGIQIHTALKMLDSQKICGSYSLRSCTKMYKQGLFSLPTNSVFWKKKLNSVFHLSELGFVDLDQGEPVRIYNML